MRPDLAHLLAEATELELAAYWLAFLLDRELERERPLPARVGPLRYALAA